VVALYASALLSATLHFKFFVLESLIWGSPTANRIFKLKAEVANSETVRTFAFNMGFYNLFLSLGTLWALFLHHNSRPEGVTLLTFCAASMVAAGLVLLLSGGRRRLLAALVQSGPPALCLLLLWA